MSTVRLCDKSATERACQGPECATLEKYPLKLKTQPPWQTAPTTEQYNVHCFQFLTLLHLYTVIYEHRHTEICVLPTSRTNRTIRLRLYYSIMPPSPGRPGIIPPMPGALSQLTPTEPSTGSCFKQISHHGSLAPRTMLLTGTEVLQQYGSPLRHARPSAFCESIQSNEPRNSICAHRWLTVYCDG